MSEPTPVNERRRPVFEVVDVKDLVERLDPTRHEPTVEYEFSNGRRFKRKQASLYDE
jgi:hypothetical protein